MRALSFLVLHLFAQDPAEVPVYWTGTKSRVVTKEAGLVTEKQAWVRLYLRHLGDTKEPDRQDLNRFMFEKGIPVIDFRTQMVLKVFGGKSEPGFGYYLHSTYRETDTLVVRISGSKWRMNDAKTWRFPAKQGDNAWGFFVLPRNFKKARVELGTFEGTVLDGGYVVLGTYELR